MPDLRMVKMSRFAPLFCVVFSLMALTLAAFLTPSFAANTPDKSPSGLPIPRFVNLKNDQTWGRVGPSTDYPVRYELSRRGLPMQVIAETRDNVWRKVQDSDGETMWIHRSQLVSAQKALVIVDGTMVRTKPSEGAAIRAKLEAGVLVRFSNCADLWCSIEVAGYRGFAEVAALWGVTAE